MRSDLSIITTSSILTYTMKAGGNQRARYIVAWEKHDGTTGDEDEPNGDATGHDDVELLGRATCNNNDKQ